MMMIDTLVVGHHSIQDLAAVAIGSSLYVSLMLGLAGVVQALGPVVAQDFGAGHHEKIGEHLRQGFWLALALAVPGCWLLRNPGWVLSLTGTSPEIAELTTAYLSVLAWCLPVSLMFRAFHAAANALGQPRILMLIGVLQAGGHAILATLLVPRWGAQGAAMSQAVMSWIACISGAWILHTGHFWQPYACLRQWSWPDMRQWWVLLRLGVPMGISYLVEITAFTFVALFVARLGAEVVAAHRIVANLSATIYMLPLAVATATSALVGQAIGARRESEAARMALAGIVIASGGAMLAGGLIWIFRVPIAGLGSMDETVIGLAASLMFYIAIYQLPDGVQTVAGFALRGYKVTFLPLVTHVTAFWGLGLGVGYWLAFEIENPMGVAGFWYSSVLSTLGACVLLGGLLIWVVRNRRHLSIQVPIGKVPMGTEGKR